MSDLIDTTEMYLKTVFELIEDGVVPLRARIAERLGHSGPTVSQTVARLERDGLMHVSGDRHLELTDEGMARATRVMRKHRLAERLLLDVIGLDWPHVHEEACRWEHVMSDQVEQQLVSLMSQPEHDPYGNPIPAADGTVISTREGSRALADVLEAEPVSVQITRIGEPLQVDVELLAALQQAGITPGTTVRFHRGSDAISAQVEGSEEALDLPPEIARHLFVARN
ncbi:MAG TPA: iron dependent repressor, metal binding and dimerization domain protein [Ruania sp.]|nr:iron dependent repressor, metal binding and dimerization domain protein [Ruania sp.]